MEPCRVLVVAEAVSPTRVGWMLTAARKLDPRRFDVHLAWHPRFNHLLGPLEFPFHPLPGLEPKEYFNRLSKLTPLYDLNVLERYVAWELEVFREIGPRVVVGDVNPSLLTSTSVAQIPLVTLGLAHWSPQAPGPFLIPELPVGRKLNAAVHRTVFRLARPWIFGAYTRDLNEVISRFGGHRLKADPRWVFSSGDWTLYCGLPGIPPLVNLPPNQRFLGPLGWSPPVAVYSSLEPRLGRPQIYVDWAPTWVGELAPLVMKSVNGLNGKVAVGVEEDAEFPVPAGWVREGPHSGIGEFSHAEAVICGGGIGSAMSALSHGLPIIGIPTNIDQMVYMELIQKAGMGVMVRPGRLSPSTLEEAVHRVRRDPGYLERARFMAERIRANDSADVLNEVVEQTSTVLSSWGVSPPLPVTIPREGAAIAVASVEEARTLVRAAHVAPTAGNSQPLRYVWTGEAIELRVDPERYNRFMDLAHTDLWAVVGGALFNMEVAANVAGKGLRVDLFPEGGQGLVARVRYGNPPGSSGVLAEGLETRCTNRRPFRDRPLDRAVREELSQWADRPGVQLDWIEDPVEIGRAAKALALFDRILFGNKNVGRCVLHWVRPDKPGQPASSEGMTVSSLELGAMARFWVRWALTSWGRFLLGPILGPVAERENARRYRQSAAIGVLTIDNWDPGTMVRAGQAMQALWLAAARRGVAVHPLAGPVLMEIRRRRMGSGLSERERAWAERVRDQMGALVPAFVQRVPFLVFRAGYADPPSSRSGRLPLERVFQISHGP